MLTIRSQKFNINLWGSFTGYCVLQWCFYQLLVYMHFQIDNIWSYKTTNYINVLHWYSKVKTFSLFLCFQDKAQAKQAILAEQNRTSPFPTGVLTPPQSSKKQSAGLKQMWLYKLLTDNFAEVPVLLVLTSAPLWKGCQWSS